MTVDTNVLNSIGQRWAELGDDLGRTQKPLDEATHLPSYIYTSDEVFELEKDQIFKQDWLAVARVEEIEKPGDYMMSMSV